jgi:hypothetical protein
VRLCLVAMPACTTGSGTHSTTAPACVSDATAPSCRNGSGRSFSAPCPNRGLYSTPPHDIESRRIRWHWHTYGISRIHSQKKKSAAPLVAEAHILQNPWLRPPGLVPPPCDDGSEAGPAGSRFSGGGGRWAPRRAAQPVTRTPAVGGVAISGHGTTRSDPTGAQTGPGIAIFPDRTGLDHAMQVQMQRA